MTPTLHISKDLLYPLFRKTSGAVINMCLWWKLKKNQNYLLKYLPRYAGVPTTDRRKDFSPIIRANPKSHNLTCGKSEFELSSTFSGFRSQWTIFLLCKCFNAIKI